MVDMAITAVKKVVQKRGDYTEVDVKRYVRIEKIPGGQVRIPPLPYPIQYLDNLHMNLFVW